MSIFVLLFACIFGCDETVTSKQQDLPEKNSLTSGMIEYLESQNLPPLRSVENWQNKYGPGLKLTTKHYEIYTTLLDPLMLSQVPGFMESAYRGYQKQLPEPIPTTRKFTIYVFATRKQWEDFTKGFTGPQAHLYCKIKAGAYYLNGSCVAYNIGRDRTFAVLGHEGWHQFNSRHFRYRLPSWLDEGIAMMFETSRYDKGFFIFDPSRNFYRLGALKQTLLKGKMIPLKKLITLNPGEVVGASDDAVMAFYSQSYALVRFLKEADYGKRLADYHQMLLGGLRGTWPLDETTGKIAMNRNIPLTVHWNRVVGRELFKWYIGDDFALIEQEYIRFCKKIVYHVHFKK